METIENLQRVHQGHNVRRVRINKNITQEDLAKKMYTTQVSISRYERSSVIAEDLLERFAEILEVPVDYLKTAEEDIPMMMVNYTNNPENQKDSTGASVNAATELTINNDNHMEGKEEDLNKIVELYERLLKEKDLRYEELEKRISTLEQNSK